MPELPEVENVCRGLASSLGDAAELQHVICHRQDLRFRLPAIARFKKLYGRRIEGVQRRAKYILFQLGDQVLLNHLGMTGSWRWAETPKEGPHDHVALHFSDGRYLIYNDPRRFGFFDLAKQSDLESCRWLHHLGPEPLSHAFDSAYLVEKSRRVQRPVKNFLMDQEVVVGVGNIYAAEALFRARIKPTRPATRLTKLECGHLAAAIKQVLEYAIRRGGTTLRDYRQVDGAYGGFQEELAVYGRAGQPCGQCGHKIRKKVMAGRSSFWCPTCQR